MNGHHLILGELVDYISGEIVKDTHDERYRQKIAQFLVEEKRYFKKEITPRFDLLIKADDNRAVIKVDFLITLKNKICMLIKYSPGSLVTRHRPSLAASRLVSPYQIPLVVVTNGKDA
ncbi:MAG: type I restriction enzyme HsdR N-terminal domain-containing protein, partial [Deltaproteobacteria bacterium]|nr:type I restriction enzyme HsdR N-terminal domain-containing protein [Deltaproteobacteria bacterium]